MGSSRLAKSDSHDINRMVMTFEKEKERDKREVENQFSILKVNLIRFAEHHNAVDKIGKLQLIQILDPYSRARVRKASPKTRKRPGEPRNC